MKWLLLMFLVGSASASPFVISKLVKNAAPLPEVAAADAAADRSLPLPTAVWPILAALACTAGLRRRR